MNSFFGTGPTPWDIAAKGPRPPARASVRTLSTNIEDALIGTFSRAQLDSLLPEELNLTWARDDIDPRDDTLSKRDAIRGYTQGWTLPQLAGLARRLTTEFELKSNWAAELELYIDAYQRDGGGVDGPTKNLIFAANGPKPELVLLDALNNQIEITANAEFCLVYDRPVPAEGLWLSTSSAGGANAKPSRTGSRTAPWRWPCTNGSAGPGGQPGRAGRVRRLRRPLQGRF